MPFLRERNASHKISIYHWSFFQSRKARDARQTGPPHLPDFFPTPRVSTDALSPGQPASMHEGERIQQAGVFVHQTEGFVKF